MRILRRRAVGALALSAVAVTACASGSGTAQAPSPSSTKAAVVNIEPTAAKVSKAESIAATDAACVAFYRLEPPDPGPAATFAQMREFAQRRSAALERGIADSAKVPFRPVDASIPKLVHDNFESALSIYREVLLLPTSTPTSRTDALPLMTSAQRLVIEAAVALINFGASKCAPPADEPAAPPGRGAGPLVSVAPTAVIKVGEPGLDNKSIVADRTGIWVALARDPSVVRIDPASDAIVARVKLPSAITQPIQTHDDHVWVATTTEIDRIDERTNRVDLQIPLGEVGPTDSSFTVTGNTLWVCDAEVLHRYDVATRRRAPDVVLPGSCQVLTTSGNHVTVAYGRLTDNVVTTVYLARVDASTGAIGSVAPITNLSAWGMLETASGRMFVDGTDTVEEVDVERARVVHKIARAGRPGNQMVLVGEMLWVTRQDEQRIFRYDLVHGKLVEVTGGPGVNGLAATAGSIWATNSDAGTVVRYPAELPDHS